MPIKTQCLFVMSALSMFVAGCGGGDDASEPTAPAPAPVPPTPTARATVTLQLAARPAHVQTLTLQLAPVALRRPLPLTSVNVLSDEQGRAMPPTITECDKTQCYPVSSSRPINLLSSTGLRTETVAFEHEIPGGDYNAARINSINQVGVRDARAILDDQRECEINLRGLNGEDIVVPVPMHVVEGQLWTLNLTLDVGSVNPADCDDGTLDLTAVLGHR